MNIPYVLGHYLTVAHGSKSTSAICGGHYVTPLAEHFHVLTPTVINSLCREPDMGWIDDANLAGMRVIKRPLFSVGHGKWAWKVEGAEGEQEENPHTEAEQIEEPRYDPPRYEWGEGSSGGRGAPEEPRYDPLRNQWGEGGSGDSGAPVESHPDYARILPRLDDLQMTRERQDLGYRYGMSQIFGHVEHQSRAHDYERGWQHATMEGWFQHQHHYSPPSQQSPPYRPPAYEPPPHFRCRPCHTIRVTIGMRVTLGL